MEEIICKVYNPKHQIGITNEGKIYAIRKGKIILCVEVVHMGSIHYKIKGSSTKISKKQIYKNSIENYYIQSYCPF